MENKPLKDQESSYVMVNPKPLIAVVTGTSSDPDQNFSLINNYLKAVHIAGGQTKVLYSPEPSEATYVLDGIDGVLLTGGGDIPSYFWGEEPKIKPQPKDEKRAQFEIPLIREIDHKKIPILGICLGLQAINVAFGGTLYDDLSSSLGKIHCKKQDGSSSYHEINILPNKKLSSLFPPKIEVNSRHHQTVKTLGKNLVVSATASDGVIEAIEKEGPVWIVGVQWHPEDLFEKDIFQQRIFEAFIKNCKQ